MKHAKIGMEWLAACVLLAGTAWTADAAPARRESVVSGGVTWSYSLIGETATVTGADPAEGVLEIPSSLDGHAVGSVGYRAFASCEELTRVVVPAGAEDIGTNAFFHCDGLKKLYAPMPWWNTSKIATAGVGGGCTVVYGEPGKATLVFDANGGACATAGRGYAPGEPYGWLPDASKEKHSFEGWWTATTGGTRVWATDTASASEGWRPLYARWAPLTQSVTFDANGGVCDTTNRVYAAGDPYSPLPAATREHYDFAGWWTSSWGGTNITEETLVTTNATRTLYARWPDFPRSGKKWRSFLKICLQVSTTLPCRWGRLALPRCAEGAGPGGSGRVGRGAGRCRPGVRRSAAG